MTEIKFLDPTKKSNTFNPIEHINLLKLEDKFAFLDVFYNSCLPSFFPHSRLSVSNFFIQEYRANQSKNMLEYFEKDFKIPMLFPICLSDYEKIRNMSEEDNNMYDCPISEKMESIL
ncbi:hypothetical protein EFE32_12940 [Lactococcus lactis subsp. lactis]|uniref:hypothetical protein n=1 Tax=Lactococcus lactis TaxID=1358 RepID=UPI00223C1348|nr:hypothetical protein [Lactococcus lactis]MCT0017677.1 hypothetical protein [Lactococcus lactis subsp. lactis]